WWAPHWTRRTMSFLQALWKQEGKHLAQSLPPPCVSPSCNVVGWAPLKPPDQSQPPQERCTTGASASIRSFLWLTPQQASRISGLAPCPFLEEPVDVFKHDIQARDQHQDDGCGEDDAKAQGNSHRDQLVCLIGSFKNNRRQSTKGGQSSEQNGAKTAHPGLTNHLKSG